MNIVLVKILATALAFSQVSTRPETIKTYFDPVKDTAEIAALLNAGCTHMRQSFDLEAIDLDGLLATAMEDAEPLGEGIKALKGLSIRDLHATYQQFCKGETAEPTADLSQVAEFYNDALKDLPDVGKLKGMALPQMSTVLDSKGQPFAELYKDNHRRISVPAAEIPSIVRSAFIAVEDKRFLDHRGFDERGLVRAFVANLAQPGRPQGGSTITQQVAKNFLVGNDVTYERKIQEIIAAARIEQLLTKQEILELYLNGIYLGRGTWGVEMAARAYFGKAVSALSGEEAALLAGLAKGPNYFSPDRNKDRALSRYSYAIARMKDDNVLGAAREALPPMLPYERLRRETGFHFVDLVTSEAKAAGIPSLDRESYKIRSTINVDLQRATEAVLQEGLFRYESWMGRDKFLGAEGNLTASIKNDDWLTALLGMRLPLYDVHWQPAVVLDVRGPIKVGLGDGSISTLTSRNSSVRKVLKRYDVIYVRSAKSGRSVDLRIRPAVQGAVLILENRTGRILSMAGAFSYPGSQLNRAVQSVRQPGSTFKPLTYLAALQDGLQPNTLVRDTGLTLPPIGETRSARASDYWSPRNADGGSSGPITLRRALENSRNLATAQLMAKGFGDSAEQGLDRVCALAIAGLLYKDCMRYYPFILGAQPLRLIDLAAFYAAIANEGARPQPHAIESIEATSGQVYSAKHKSIMIADPVPAAQLKSMLQGVLANGTARAFRHLAPYAAGKTGTTDDEVDAWFVGFTNDVTIAIWVGYDNAGGKRRTLGRGQSGGRVALPMFEPVLEAVWEHHAPKSPMNGPSQDAMQELVVLDNGAGQTDYIRRGFEGMRSALVSLPEDLGSEPDRRQRVRRETSPSASIFGIAQDRVFGDWRPRQAPARFRSFREDLPSTPRRVDPDYPFGGRFN